MQTTATETRVFWRDGFQPSVPAHVIYSELLKQGIAIEALTPDQYVEIARPESSPLHDSLPWDDAVAAHAHRKHLARQLINGLRIITVEGRVETPFLNVHVKDKASGYLAADAVMADDEMREYVMAKARRYFATGRQKYAELSEFARVFDAIDQLDFDI